MQIYNNFNFTHRYNFSGTLQKETNVAELIDEKNMVDTFIKMVKMDTGSDEEKASYQTPSTPEQRVFANWLKNTLVKIGVENVELDDNCFVTGKISSNVDKNLPKIAFFAHMDTENLGKNICPQIHNYQSGPIQLENGKAISDYYLSDHQNKKIITTNGETNLGADDKAGIAEILAAVKLLKANPNIKHPEIKLAFTPDEECVGHLAIKKFDIKKFGADYGYTIDGDSPHIVEKENYFNKNLTLENMKYYLSKLIDAEVSEEKIEKYKKLQLDEEKFSKVYKYARLGLEKSKIDPEIMYIRGITDGSYLSINGLPTANLGTGGYLGHTVYEFAVVEDMKKCVENIINILSVWAEKE